MTATYEKIATTTVGSATASVTFSSIPGSYTDLVIVCNGTMASGEESLAIQFNSDTASNYSTTFMYTAGVTASGSRQSSQTKIYVGRANTANSTSIFNIMNYSNTTTYKTTLARGNDSALVIAQCGLWRSTAAITSLVISSWGGYNFSTGHTLTIYGIKAE
jgi:hypothetical protein